MLIILESINSFPVDKAFYPTIMLYGVFIGTLITYGVLFGVIYCMFILSTGAAGDALTREVSPNSLGTLEQWTPLALSIPTVIWAFGQSCDEVFPVYMRGIELTIEGVIFGLLFLRFGIMACIIAHYVFNTVMIGIPLLESGNAYYIISGVIVCLLAALPMMDGWNWRASVKRVQAEEW